MRGASALRVAISAAWLATLACAPPPALPTQNQIATAAWFDRAIDRSAEVVVHVDLASPRAVGDAPLRAAIVDALLGVVTRSLSRGPDLHRAVEAASEMIVATPVDGEPTLALRGVPPSLDPRSLAAADGATQWTLGVVGEYVEYNYAPAAGSLFVLRDGSWLIGAGTAAQSMKNAFVTAGGAPILPRAEPSTRVATLWVPASALHAVAIKEKLRLLRPVFLQATSLEATLGEDDVAEARLRYPSERDALEAHAALVDTVRAFGRRNDPKTAWIGDAKLSHDGATVSAAVTIPPSVFQSFTDAY